ncbi:MAG: hypothetical protein HQL50_15900 [Magnetococcales bacterium]|nr:hypothetical protein [Magnetococcales bacterium]
MKNDRFHPQLTSIVRNQRILSFLLALLVLFMGMLVLIGVGIAYVLPFDGGWLLSATAMIGMMAIFRFRRKVTAERWAMIRTASALLSRTSPLPITIRHDQVLGWQGPIVLLIPELPGSKSNHNPIPATLIGTALDMPKPGLSRASLSRDGSSHGVMVVHRQDGRRLLARAFTPESFRYQAQRWKRLITLLLLGTTLALIGAGLLISLDLPTFIRERQSAQASLVHPTLSDWIEEETAGVTMQEHQLSFRVDEQLTNLVLLLSIGALLLLLIHQLLGRRNLQRMAVMAREAWPDDPPPV